MDTEIKNRVPLYSIMVRKDALTIVPTTVTSYEIPILATLFGGDNVQTVNGGLLSEEGVGNPVSHFAIEDERDRLGRKYGDEIVEAVYGSPAMKGLEKAVAKVVVSASEAGEQLEKANAVTSDPRDEEIARLKEALAAAGAEQPDRKALFARAKELELSVANNIATEKLIDAIEKAEAALGAPGD